MPEPLPHADDGFHEIQLSGKQLVFLFMATTIVAVVIFLCGVLVGRGVRPSAAAGSASVAAAPFAATTGEPAPVPAPPAVGSAPQGGSGTPEDLSYHRRLQGEAGAPSGAAAEDRLKVRDTEPPKPADPPVAVASAPPPGPEGGWVVQIAALRDRAAADAIVRRLTSKGYPTFMLEPPNGAPAPGFRVRVGRYGDRREAERVARRLEREEQFRPFITR